MPNLFIIAGCNGAGKTTASNTIFPDIMSCREFVNADNIAHGISPYNTEDVAIEAGKIMLRRINELLIANKDFAFETTLSSLSYVSLVTRAKEAGYMVTLIYIWLNSPELAKERVANRVKNGGHNIPEIVVERRYYKGLRNLFKLFMPRCNNWFICDNSEGSLVTVARKGKFDIIIENKELWEQINKQFYAINT